MSIIVVQSEKSETPQAVEWPDRAYFFDKGLRFECQRCGACCTGAPGIVRVGLEERQALAKEMRMNAEEFTQSYCRPLEAGFCLQEQADGRCILYEHECLVYAHRPQQCKSFPFWFRNLRSEMAWKLTQAACPGVGKGRIYRRDEILEMLR